MVLGSGTQALHDLMKGYGFDPVCDGDEWEIVEVKLAPFIRWVATLLPYHAALGEIDFPSEKLMSDNVYHPAHYNSGKFEVIDVIEDWNLNFNLGNTVKYLARAGKKDPTKHREDLEKACWYLKREIDRIGSCVDKCDCPA